MFIGLKINTFGEMEEIHFNTIYELFSNTITPIDMVELLETHEITENFNYWVYSSKNFLYEPNVFNIHSTDVFGDILVIAMDNEDKYLNINIDEFLDYYCNYEDLDDMIIEDETNIDDSDEYDFGSFIIDDFDN